ncbi:MAG TPA: SDR family oxidoreductase [Acidimicrobiales bacterium]|nr:SDR family oxidoreductase [Acidimicrobiales bacterium]
MSEGRGGRLDGEVAIVTGSTSGLGKEIATLFAEEGCRVVVTGRDPDRGAQVERSIAARGGQARFLPADLEDEAQCRELARQARQAFGPVTVLVNNAVASTADFRDGPVTEVSAQAFAATLRTDLVAPATMCRLVIPQMLEAGHGSIVNVSSRAAERATPKLAAYTAAKGGLNALTRSITIDFARHGVRANTLQPGYVIHERRDASMSPEERLARQSMHLTRLATARDVAYAALFLASRESEVVAGITLRVDGGSSAARGRVLG